MRRLLVNSAHVLPLSHQIYPHTILLRRLLLLLFLWVDRLYLLDRLFNIDHLFLGRSLKEFLLFELLILLLNSFTMVLKRLLKSRIGLHSWSCPVGLRTVNVSFSFHVDQFYSFSHRILSVLYDLLQVHILLRSWLVVREYFYNLFAFHPDLLQP